MFLKIGHRGAAGYEPENTLRSLRRAIEMGADMIELDVHRAKDGAIVVIHDDKVNRTTNGKGRVAEMTLAEIKELDAGKGEKVPILDEALDLAAGKVPVDIEIKDSGLGAEVGKTLATRIKNGARSGDFVISSFLPDELSEKDYPSGTRRFLLADKRPMEAIKTAAELKCWGIGPRAKDVDEDLMRAAYSAGLAVIPWTANRPALIEKLKELGVDGIFSNFPDRL